MPPPSTVEEMLERVRRSGIVPSEQLEAFLARQEAAARSPAELLERLQAAGLITAFHADKLAAGKYKGFVLGSYLILDQLGSGGMGQVFLAEHIRMHRLVALKVLPPHAYDDPTARERFFREARAAAQLDHPNIVRVYDLCEEGPLLFLVLEYVDGTSLQQIVARHGPLPIAQACDYVRQAAFGLLHATELGFVHRDIKPANLLLDRHGVIKILDFGLVRSLHDAEGGLTRRLDNVVLGTADYVAPEQAIDSSAVDVRADLYSLGATFYFLLAGHPLFPEGKTAQKLLWQQMREPTPIHERRPDVPVELSAVVHRLLRKKPEERYQHPAELLEALAPFIPAQVPLPDPAWLPVHRGRVAARLVNSSGSGSFISSTSQVLVAALRGGTTTLTGPSSSGVRLFPSSQSLTPTSTTLSSEETKPDVPRTATPPQSTPTGTTASAFALPVLTNNSAIASHTPYSPNVPSYFRLVIFILSATLLLALAIIVLLLVR
ncbi:MAG: serine/threonine protein kinase [Gemmataceae bacterium]|nr:serine/threonine protein kinase [Gemmataceae bacterium]